MKKQVTIRIHFDRSKPSHHSESVGVDGDDDEEQVSMDLSLDAATSNLRFPPTPGFDHDSRDGHTAPTPASPSMSTAESLNSLSNDEHSFVNELADQYRWREGDSSDYLHTFSSSPPPTDPASVASIVSAASSVTCCVCGQPSEECRGLMSHIGLQDHLTEKEGPKYLTDARSAEMADTAFCVPSEGDDQDDHDFSSDSFQPLKHLHTLASNVASERGEGEAVESFLSPHKPTSGDLSMHLCDNSWRKYAPRCKSGFSGERRWCAPLRSYFYDTCPDHACEPCMNAFFTGNSDDWESDKDAMPPLSDDDLGAIQGGKPESRERPLNAFQTRLQDATKWKTLNSKSNNHSVKAALATLKPSTAQNKPLKPPPPLRQKYSTDFDAPAPRILKLVTGSQPPAASKPEVPLGQRISTPARKNTRKRSTTATRLNSLR